MVTMDDLSKAIILLVRVGAVARFCWPLPVCWPVFSCCWA